MHTCKESFKWISLQHQKISRCHTRNNAINYSCPSNMAAADLIRCSCISSPYKTTLMMLAKYCLVSFTLPCSNIICRRSPASSRSSIKALPLDHNGRLLLSSKTSDESPFPSPGCAPVHHWTVCYSWLYLSENIQDDQMKNAHWSLRLVINIFHSSRLCN